MAGKALAVAKSKEIQRLKELGFSDRAIARTLKIHRNTVKAHLSDHAEPQKAVEPAWTLGLDWQEIDAEISRGTPLQVLWEELTEVGKIKVQYPAFWKQLRKRCPNIALTMRRVFAPGDRIEIDYCDGIDLLEPLTGEIIKTHLFVGVLCYSRYTFAEFSLTQTSEDFLTSHVRMLDFFGGTTPTIAPDNLKSAITKAHRYDPVINPAYTRLAEHYQFAVTPARVMRPKDKAIVERSIQIFQKWFYFRVRRRTFTSLVELNNCLREHLGIFNAKIHRIFKKSRQEMFAEERSALRPLPEASYHVAVHRKATLHPDCHLSFDHNFYSAPYQLRGKQLDVWATAKTVEIYYEAERVAFHKRCRTRSKFITDRNHYPPAQQAYFDATPQYVRDQAARLGPEISKLIHKMLNGPCPLQHLRRAQGIVRLEKKYGRDALEKACGRANDFGQMSFHFIERLLKTPGLLDNRRPDQAVKRGNNQLLRGEELFH